MSFTMYFAGTQSNESEKLLGENNFKKLFSYYNDKSSMNRWFELYPNNKIFIDSGAFTAWTKNISIDVDTYIEFLNNHVDNICLAGQVDCIAGELNRKATMEEQYKASQDTWENYLYMYSKLKNPDCLLYTFHIGEDFKFLKQALSWKNDKGEHFKYMALGGTVGKPVKEKEEWFRKCWEIIKNSDNPDVKVHAFGMTSLKLLEKFPFSSADSTSWLMTGANGNIFTKYGTIPISNKLSKLPEHYSHLPKQCKEEVINEIQKIGYTVAELEDNYITRSNYNILYTMEWAKNHKPVYKKSIKKSLF